MGNGGIAPLFFTSALDGGEWSASRPGRFTPGEIGPGNDGIGVWVGPRAGLDAVEDNKSHPCQESNTDRPASSPSLYWLNYYHYHIN
jgi:hypothetical protein